MPTPAANAPSVDNPFINNKFNYNLQSQQPQQGGVDLLPGRNIVTDGGFGQYGGLYNSTPSGNMNTNSGSKDNSSMGDMAGAGLSGLGNYLSAAGQADAHATDQMGNIGNSLMSGINNQRQMDQSGAQAALPYSSPEKTVIPFEKMALARSLANAGPPQISTPAGLPTQQVDNSGQWKAMQDTMNQFFSPMAIQAAQTQQQKGILNVDPGAPVANLAATWGDSAGTQAAQNDLNNWQVNQQNQRVSRDGQAQAALQQALSKAKDNGGSWLGGLGSALGAAAPYIAMAL